MNQHKEAQTILGEYIQRIIDRAVKEPAYRALLFSDPGTVLGGYPLTHEERIAFARLVPESWYYIFNDSRPPSGRAYGSGRRWECGLTVLAGGLGD